MKHLILKTAAPPSQISILLGAGLIALIIGWPAVVWFYENFTGQIEYSPINFWDIAYFLLFLVSLVLILIVFVKEGISLGSKKVNSSYFLFGKLIKTRKIELAGACDICILRFNMVRNTGVDEESLGFDETMKYTVYRVYGLNKTHSKRILIFAAKSQDQAKKVMKEVSPVLGLNYVKYNPPGSKRRRK